VAHTFDDRLDTDTRLTNRAALRLLARAFPYVYPTRRLYFLKLLTMTGSVIPILIAPWPLKIVIDHVVLAKPIGGGAVGYPPGIDWLVAAMAGLAPMEIMLATTTVLLVVVALFGLTQFVGGPQGILTSSALLAQGDDVATRAENQASAGWSIAGGLWGYLDLKVNLRLAQTATHVFRAHLLERLYRLPLTTLDDSRIGDAIYRVMYDTASLPSICFNLTITPITEILLVGALLLVMHGSFGDAAPELVYLALAGIPVVFLFTLPFTGYARRVSQDARASGAATTDTIEEGMSNIAAVQGLGGLARERARFDADSRESFRNYRRFYFAQLMTLAVSVTAGIAIALYAWVLTSDKVIEGRFTPGDYWVVLGMYTTIAATLGGFARIWFDLQDNIAGMRRVLFFIDLPGEDGHQERGQSDLLPLQPVRDNVTIEDADVVYPDGRQALRGANLTARVGEVVALVGPTGAGKTSLAYLIPAFLRPARGHVSIDGVDLAGVDVESLRAQIAYVFQENWLFTGSIADNIRVGRSDASDDDVVAAARTAGAHEFIAKLPDGYATLLGRGGNTLSVGQKQRLCIARALVRDARILIFDEPTSALDPETERSLVAALHAASRDHIVIVIAHRLSTIRGATRIVFLDDGRVVEEGSHDELMRLQGGAYRRFVEASEAS
jgi:ABC-type multidrug transport system fused ATPase/permease subunit